MAPGDESERDQGLGELLLRIVDEAGVEHVRVVGKDGVSLIELRTGIVDESGGGFVFMPVQGPDCVPARSHRAAAMGKAYVSSAGLGIQLGMKIASEVGELHCR